MRTIWKFELEGPDSPVMMPRGAEILCAQIQERSGKLPAVCVWALVTPDAVKERRRFVSVGTGHPVPDEIVTWNYVDTVQMGELVWHVFVDRL